MFSREGGSIIELEVDCRWTYRLLLLHPNGLYYSIALRNAKITNLNH